MFQFILILLIGLVITGCSTKQEAARPAPSVTTDTTTPAGYAQVSTDSVTAADTLYDWERTVIENNRSGLAMLARKSTTAATILEFFDSNKVLTHNALPGGELRTVEGSRSPFYFAVYADKPPQAIQRGQYLIRVDAMFNRDNRALALYESPPDPLSDGLVLAHELTHARDWVFGLEPPSAPYSEPWLFGEMQANATCSQILNEMTDSAWYHTCLQSLDERHDSLRVMGKDPWDFTVSHMPGDSARIHTLFRDVGEHAMATLLMQITVDANVINVQQLAVSPEKEGLGIREFFTAFYKHYEVDLSRL